MKDRPEPPSFEDTQIAFAAKTNHQLRQSYWLFRLFSNNAISEFGTWATQLAFKWHLPITPLVKHTIFQQFVGGETLRDLAPSIKHLSEYGIKSILDYGVEGKSTEHDFDNTLKHLLQTLAYVKDKPDATIISAKITGLARFSLLEKLHAGQPLSTTEQAEYERVRHRVRQLCQAAAEANTGIFFDAEETWIQQPLDDLIEEMMQLHNRQRALVFNTYQLYRNDRLPHLKEHHHKAEANGYILGAKLVRGAYMEKERERAAKKGYPSPIHANKAAVDKDYNLALDYCLHHYEGISFCCATHNEESCQHLCQRVLELGIDRKHPHIFFSQLYGMGDHLTFNLAKAGFNSSKYMPYGPVREVVPYLVRRAQENSSVSGQVGRELGLLQREMKRRGL